MTKFSEMKAAAKMQLSDRWWPTVGVLIVAEVILSAIGVFSIVLFGVLQFGVAIYMLGVVRGRKTEFGMLFRGFNRFGETCLAGVLVSIFTALWSLLFLIPGIIKSYAYSMTFYIMQDDPTLTASQAIEESQRMMKGYKGKLFLLDLSFIGWHILDLLTFGILGVLYVSPYKAATVANFYEQLRYANPPVRYGTADAQRPTHADGPSAPTDTPSDPFTAPAEPQTPAEPQAPLDVTPKDDRSLSDDPPPRD